MIFTFFNKIFNYFFPSPSVPGDDSYPPTEPRTSTFSMGTITPSSWYRQQLETPTSPSMEITISPPLGPGGTANITSVEWRKLELGTAMLWPSQAISILAPGGVFGLRWVGSFKVLTIHGIIGDRMYLTAQYVYPFQSDPIFVALRQQHEMPRGMYLYYYLLGLSYVSFFDRLEQVHV